VGLVWCGDDPGWVGGEPHAHASLSWEDYM